MASLQRRIEERFPGSSLGQLSQEILRVSNEAAQRSVWIQKPNLPLRLGVTCLVIVMPCLLLLLISTVKQFQVNDISSFLQSLDAGIGSIVFIGAAIVFLVSWERRIKRARALKALHELRAMAHIIDMHQLTKDPESYVKENFCQTASSPKRTMTPFELGRYLGYCTECLAMLSKIAALYVQGFQDPVLLDSVDDLEDLVSGLSQKIWQKITLIETLTKPGQSRAAAS